ncbi:hypothetical protein CBL_08572 [Carabus blaptoides fortunei]
MSSMLKVINDIPIVFTLCDTRGCDRRQVCDVSLEARPTTDVMRLTAFIASLSISWVYLFNVSANFTDGRSPLSLFDDPAPVLRQAFYISEKFTSYHSSRAPESLMFRLPERLEYELIPVAVRAKAFIIEKYGL